MSLADGLRRALSGEAGATRASAEAEMARSGATVIVRLDTGADGPGRLTVLRKLAVLLEKGAEPAWDGVFAPQARLTTLPAHPFRRRRYWFAERTPLDPHPASVEAPDEWFFECAWPGLDRPAPKRLSDRHWLLVGGAPALVETARTTLLASGARLEHLPAELLGPDSPGFESMLSGAGKPWAVVDLRALDDARVAGTPEVGISEAGISDLVAGLAELHRELDRAGPDVSARLWLVTKGALAVQVSEAPRDPAAAALWSLGRSLALAVPERWGGRLDLDPDRPCDIPALLETVAWSAISGEDEAALRSGGLHVARLRRAEPPERRTLTLNSAATYLVTGAFGGVGPLVARWLARRGAGRIVLAGRHVPDLGADGPWRMLGAELGVLGAQPVFVRCDVADPADLAQLMRTAHLAERPLRGIWHAAAATATGDGLDRASVAAVFASKVEALLAIGAAARDLPLDHLVLFSSAAATLGERTRPAYAAANGFLDAFAAQLRAQGRPCLSIQWGLWGGRDASHADVRFFRRAGLSEMAPDRALDAMERLIAEAGGARRQPMVTALDGNRLWSALELKGRARFLEALAGPGPASDARAASPRPASSPADLLEAVAREVRAVLELDPGEPLDLDRGFFDLGMDSLMSVALKGRLEVLFGEALPSTVTMDYPSVRALANYFGGGGDASGALVDPPTPSATVLEAVEEPLAVERMSDAEVLDALEAELAELALDAAE